MARVGILSQYADVTVMLDHLLTPGHESISIEHALTIASEAACVPDIVVVPLFRKPPAIARPVEDFLEDIAGANMLMDANRLMDGHQRPIIVFGIGVSPDEVPSDLHYHTYLTFPQAIQELNPLISSLVGPAEQAQSPA